MPQYKIWWNREEQWDANDIDPPVAVIDGNTLWAAAETFADRYNEQSNDTVDIIAQDEVGNYFEVRLGKKWDIVKHKATSLAELCEG